MERGNGVTDLLLGDGGGDLRSGVSVEGANVWLARVAVSLRCVSGGGWLPVWSVMGGSEVSCVEGCMVSSADGRV